MDDLIQLCRQRLNDLRRRSTLAMGQLKEADLNWRPNEESNSIANLVLHLEGNLRQRMASLGGPTFQRDRDGEFNQRGPFAADQLLGRLNEAVWAFDELLGNLDPEMLDRTHPFNDREISTAELVLQTVTHFAEHAGQILYIAKLRLGEEYKILAAPHRKKA